MANQYLVGIHSYINGRIEDIHAKLMNAAVVGDKCRKRYLEGQLEELYAARQFLSSRYDLSTQTYY
jgi:hypothetical protein